MDNYYYLLFWKTNFGRQNTIITIMDNFLKPNVAIFDHGCPGPCAKEFPVFKPDMSIVAHVTLTFEFAIDQTVTQPAPGVSSPGSPGSPTSGPPSAKPIA